MRSILLSVLLFAAALPVSASQIVLYERQNFSGRSLVVDRAQPNLGYQGFENRASSVFVMEGTWEFCTQPYFQGNCRIYSPGEYRALGGQQNRISSVRPLRDGSGGGGDGWSPGAAEAELYDGQNFQGRIGTLRGPAPNFEPLGLNDRVASIIIRRGTWEFCTDANYRNNCRVYGPGEYAQIWGGQDDKYSSARPVSGGWGSGSSGGSSGGGSHPGSGWGGGSFGGAPRIRLFEYANFGGRSIWLRDSINSFEQINFNDRAESMIVEGGEWRLCSDADGQGNCQTFRPGQYPILPGGLRNSVSSAYRR